MASPTSIRAKWPSQKRMASDSTSLADFVPYLSNLANSFRKAPRPMAPAFMDPIPGTTISLDNARSEVNNAARAGDLSTAGLDAQTGAAIRVGNLASKMRSLSDISSKEAMINLQSGAQTKQINASIGAQNTMITNQYRDDIVNSQIAQAREQSENLSNAADKYIGQRAVRDQMDLDRERTIIMSKAYDQGVYNRLGTKLQESGIDIPGTTPTNPFQKYRQMGTTPYTPGQPLDLNTQLYPRQLDKMKNYMNMRNTYAAGGMLPVFSDGDPTKPGKGSPKPTTADSLALYNNTQQVLNYYRTRNYRERPFSVEEGSYSLHNVEETNRTYNKDRTRLVPTKGGRSTEMAVPQSLYHRDIDSNRFYQREVAHSILDTRAPMAMYDRRILPNGYYSFSNELSNDALNGDEIQIPGYDPIAVKPWNMLTPNEKTTRIKKYGNPTGAYKAPVAKTQSSIAEIPLNPSKVRGISPTGGGNVVAGKYQSADLTPQKTKFSATYRDENDPSKQTSIYFKDRNAWKGFLNTGALSTTDTRETSDQASATGYRTYAGGGKLKRRKYASGGKMIKPFC